jgi:O-antigen/teichoic acid export membrane protein
VSSPAPQERLPREATTGTIERMGRGGGLNIVGALTNQAAMFAAISVMAWLGQRQVGRYATCLALLALLSLLSLAGFRSALTRFVAMHVADGDAARLRGTVRLGLGLTLAGSVVVALVLALVAPWAALAATGLIWVDTLLLGALTDQRHVGSYNVATRLVMLAVFVMAPINAAFTPHMAHLLHRGERAEAARAYGTASRWILGLSMPAFVVLVVFPNQLLTYFGKGYAAAAAVTVILAFGQLVSAAAGPCGTVLNMSGRVGLNMVDNVAVLVVNVVLNLVLIPRYGIVGAAVAWSASLVAVNIAKVLQAYLVVGIRAAGAGIQRSLFAGGVAAAVALLTERWVSDWDDVVLIGAPTVLVVFCAVMVVLGVPADDRALMGRLLPGRVHRRSGAADRAQRVASADLRTDTRGGGRHVA